MFKKKMVYLKLHLQEFFFFNKLYGLSQFVPRNLVRVLVSTLHGHTYKRFARLLKNINA